MNARKPDRGEGRDVPIGSFALAKARASAVLQVGPAGVFNIEKTCRRDPARRITIIEALLGLFIFDFLPPEEADILRKSKRKRRKP